jgi:transcriptional regulator GlxA family with amidase domain
VVLPAVVERAVVWLRARLRESAGEIFSNKEIAEAAGCSVPWLQFLFKRHFGWYPVQVARRARLDRAVELLAETEYPVAVVAAMCGFVHASHLSLHLRKHLGEDASGIRGKARAGTLRVKRLSPLTGRLVDLG